MKRTAIMFVLLCPALRAAANAADSDRGAGLFVTLSCVQCHSINGTGGKAAPDLGRMVDRCVFCRALVVGSRLRSIPRYWSLENKFLRRVNAL